MGNCFTATCSCDKTCESVLGSTTRRATYICKLKDNLEALQNELRKLIEVKNDVMRKVVMVEQHQMKRTAQVQGWISRVEELEAEVGDLQKDKSKYIEKLRLGGCWSKDCQSTCEFGKRVYKKQQAVAALAKEERDFRELAYRVTEGPANEVPPY